MDELTQGLGPALRELLPLLIVLTLAALALGSGHTIIRLRERRGGVRLPFGGQLVMLAITGIAIVAAVIALPVAESTRGQLLSLLGLVLTAIVAFASTTFVANAMAGLMLRAVGNFRPGDWVRVGDQFGRVTERGLFHSELQTEDRDLTTLPNLYLVTNPVVVVRESGTIVSATLSLGYDRHHAEVETLLTEAALSAGLEEPFVQILELGDFSVTYRVAGFLAEVRHLLTARSQLRAHVLDTLHGAGVEIVSPTFMNQRALAEGHVLPAAPPPGPAPAETQPEDIIFDKAEERASRDELAAERDRLEREMQILEETVGSSADATRAAIEERRERIADIVTQLERIAVRDEKP